MNRRVVVLAVVALAAISTVGVGGVAAASTSSANASTSAHGNASSVNQTVVQSVGANLGPTTLKSWRYKPSTGALTLKFKSKTPALITTSDAGMANQRQKKASGAGGARIPAQRHTLKSGTDTVTIHPHRYDNGKRIAVTVGTTGDAYRIWTAGLPTGAHRPLKWSSVEALLGIVAAATAGLTLWRVRAALNDRDYGARRIL